MSTLGHLRRTLREHLGSVNREIRVALTPIPRPKAWAFLIGCYNSGTTLLASLLGAHPEISALHTEGQFLTDQFQADYELGLGRMWHLREDRFRLTESDAGPDADRIKKEWGVRLDRSRPVLLEKSPPNTPRTRWLQEHFENAHFVSIVRNGYAVAEGIVRKGEPHHRAGGWTIEEAAHQWRRSIEVVREDAPHLHRLHWMRYEDLASAPVQTLTAITEFLGVGPYLEEYLPGTVEVHEREQAVVDLNAESIRRLTPKYIETINRVASDCLTAFDYPILDPSVPEG